MLIFVIKTYIYFLVKALSSVLNNSSKLFYLTCSTSLLASFVSVTAVFSDNFERFVFDSSVSMVSDSKILLTVGLFPINSINSISTFSKASSTLKLL